MAVSEVKEKVEQPKIDKKLAKRKLWIEYVKGIMLVLVFLVGLALVTDLNNIYFAVHYGFGVNDRPWYTNFVLLFSIAGYLVLFFAGYKKLGFKITEKIDDLNTLIDSLD